MPEYYSHSEPGAVFGGCPSEYRAAQRQLDRKGAIDTYPALVRRQNLFERRRMRCFSHVNLHTDALAAATDFYLRRCGLGISRTDGNEDAAFLSSGFNHHEIEIFRDDRTYVRHLGLEYDSPASLEARLPLLLRSAVKIERYSLVPGLMQSIFCQDPEGNGLHLFANLTTDWQDWQTGAPATVETWSVDTARMPDSRPYPATPLTVSRLAAPGGPIARRFAGGGLAADRPLELAAFYADVLGFDSVVHGKSVQLSGSLAGNCLTIEPAIDERRGLIRIDFLVSGIAAPETHHDPLGIAVRLMPGSGVT